MRSGLLEFCRKSENQTGRREKLPRDNWLRYLRGPVVPADQQGETKWAPSLRTIKIIIIYSSSLLDYVV